MTETISWIHFGDLHISNEGEQNYLDFLQLIAEGDRYMRGDIAFGLLPGDNADDAEADQYDMVKKAVSLCGFPVEAIPGDHDKAGGNLGLFEDCFPESLPRSFTRDRFHFVFLNSVSHWQPPLFGLGAEQMEWLRDDLAAAHRSGQMITVFMHAYPSEHEEAGELAALFRECGVSLVEMGHTHYNELANDGRTIYAATRSTGQVEEGPAGFSVTTLDRGVISWKFKPLSEWPLVVITSPGDRRLIVDALNPAQVVRGTVRVRARAWGEGIKRLTMALDGNPVQTLEATGGCTWGTDWDSAQVADGTHVLSVSATAAACQASDQITILVNQRGNYTPPGRHALDHENALGEWQDKHILGTQLGPNENGRHWHSRRECKHARR
jgi:3',5'-cyclic-AMP phosphodiesterase